MCGVDSSDAGQNYRLFVYQLFSNGQRTKMFSKTSLVTSVNNVRTSALRLLQSTFLHTETHCNLFE